MTICMKFYIINGFYSQIKANTPILMCSVPGYDASGRIDDLAAEINKPLTSIAIGEFIMQKKKIWWNAMTSVGHNVFGWFSDYGFKIKIDVNILSTRDYSRTCYEQPLLWAANLPWEVGRHHLYKWASYGQPLALKGLFFCITRVAAHSRLHCIYIYAGFIQVLENLKRYLKVRDFWKSIIGKFLIDL